SLAQKGPFYRLKLRVLMPIYLPLNRLVDRLGNVASIVVLVLLIAGGLLGVQIWKDPARVKTALTVVWFHWDARKPIPPCYKGIEELTRDLTNDLKDDVLPIHRERPDPKIYNAWSEAQMVASLL